MKYESSFSRKCKAPRPQFGDGAKDNKDTESKSNNWDRETEKKIARLRTVMGPVGGARRQQILEGAGVAAMELSNQLSTCLQRAYAPNTLKSEATHWGYTQCTVYARIIHAHCN